MNKPEQYKAKVTERLLMNQKFVYLHLELLEPYRINFEAGQYVSIQVENEARRSYSIASAPAINHAIELCVDVSPGGVGSSYFKNLKVGDEVVFLGPLGRFIVADNKGEKEKKLLMVATGSGIAPLRSMILDLLETKNDQRRIKLHWGLRFVEDMFWEEDFRRMSRYYDNFEFELALSKPPDRWPLHMGYVTECIEKEEGLGASCGVYLCGNKEMIEEVSQLVFKMGVPKEQIHFEKFF